MNYAIRYDSKFRHFKDVNEIVFYYNVNFDSLMYQIESAVKNENQKVVIDAGFLELDNSFDIEGLVKIRDKYKNFLIQLPWGDLEKLDLVKKANLPYMFSDYAKTREMVYAMYKAGAKEIYVVEELCFNLPALQFFRKECGIKLRIFPDVAQIETNSQKYVNPLTKFFVRPEDVSLYEEYVDTFEIFHFGEKISVIYEIYKQEQWLGNLNQIIMGLKCDIVNTSIAPHFGKCRLNCNKMCYINKCFICPEIEKLAYAFDDAGLEIVKKRKTFSDNLTQEEKEEMLKTIEKDNNELTIN